MEKQDIAGLKIDSLTKSQFLNEISNRLRDEKKTFVITPYSEFLYHSLIDNSLLDIFNRADFSVPDGIGLFWAKKFLDIPLTAKNHLGKVLQAFWQMVYTGAAILIRPSYIHSAFPEKIPGSNLIWDLAKLAADQNKTIFLLGGFGETPRLVAEKLSARFNPKHAEVFLGREKPPHDKAPGSGTPKSLIAGWSSKDPGDPTVIEDIKNSGADMVFVAYGPIKQEKWIIEHMNELPATFFIGLGGTFDYVAGVRLKPPQFIRSMGLEWLFRLLTQPHRFKRIFNAVIGLITALIKYKVFTSYPYRPNVVSVVVNTNKKILIAKYNPQKASVAKLGVTSEIMENRWIFPQGGAEEGESIETSARRELKEETGIENPDLIKISHKSFNYLWRDLGKRPLWVEKRYQWKGQSQNVVYFRYYGSNESIKLDADEFLEYRWVSPDELPNIIHRDKQPIVDIVLGDLKDLA